MDSEIRIAIAKLARRMRQERGASDLGPSQLGVLASLEIVGPQTLGELSAQERVTAPSMNRTVNLLEASGLLSRSASPDDGRKVIIELTDAGRAVLDDTRRRRDAWFGERVATLSDEEKTALEAATPVLRKLAEL
ncbi:MarR family transcriptional regulator [Salinibacterium sp. dk2585]|uniref:MarR family winged helix-turn-helix transcriptional regulator n=1 Tax=unclassified Salinibacterium TaxID=2632331 RepID=UPI0011C24D78|nr:MULTISPECIES: MarR family transcriptional regulator [unclassified Salinibacterium]QEE62417.1 MarR family transcriptional regulator [Salinibacterium sp. dk2585]TXK52700.1 MarR family transcriptional regulator [Salinibacterium sp. dk5596]